MAHDAHERDEHEHHGHHEQIVCSRRVNGHPQRVRTGRRSP